MLRSRNDRRGKMDEYERRLLQSPAVEKDYRALVRDYESSMLKYRETRAKLMEAQLSRSLELERKGERFTLIEPPTLPETPISPNRRAIVFLGIMLSLLAGAGVAYLRDRTDDSIWSGAYSGPSFGLTAPMIIPYISTGEDERRRVLMLGLCAVDRLRIGIRRARHAFLLLAPRCVLVLHGPSPGWRLGTPSLYPESSMSIQKQDPCCRNSRCAVATNARR